METLNILKKEKHIIEDKECLLLGIKRKHSYEKLTNTEITFLIESDNVILNIKKDKKDKKYILGISNIELKNINEFMMIEISEKLGNINYIVTKK